MSNSLLESWKKKLVKAKTDIWNEQKKKFEEIKSNSSIKINDDVLPSLKKENNNLPILDVLISNKEKLSVLSKVIKNDTFEDLKKTIVNINVLIEEVIGFNDFKPGSIIIEKNYS